MFLIFLILFQLLNRQIYDKNGCPYLPSCDYFFYENFTDNYVNKRWSMSMKENYNSKWKLDYLYQVSTRTGERGMITTEKGKSHLVGTKFNETLSIKENESLIFQFESRNQIVMGCTSFLMRIHTSNTYNPREETNSTEKFLEFGPDFCENKGSVINFYSNIDGKLQKHKLRHNITSPFDDISHLYTLILRYDNSFEYLVDQKSLFKGSIGNSFIPYVYEPEFIDDPNDLKPSDWEDEELIPDPKIKKPDEWNDDEPEYIIDPLKKHPPDGWLLEDKEFIKNPNFDLSRRHFTNEKSLPLIKNPKCVSAPGCGPYNPPKIKNPKYKGKWIQPMIKNPKYKGHWAPRQIKNENYVGNNYKIPDINGISFHFWGNFYYSMITNVFVGKNEDCVNIWNHEDFLSRQRFQISKMKKNYKWLYISKPIRIPYKRSFQNIFKYSLKNVILWYINLENKYIIIGSLTSLVLVFVPSYLLLVDFI